MNKESDFWRKIKGYDYLVSVHGEVMNAKTGRILKPTRASGYSRVVLSKNNKKNTYLVHRLVAIMFLDRPKDKEYVNHIDFNTANNTLGNLEWVSHDENIKHSVKNGRPWGRKPKSL